MGETLHLRTTLQPRGPAAAVVLTDEQVALLAGGPKTPAVTVTVNGRHTFAGRVGRMAGENLVGLNKAVRTAAGVEAGDVVDVVLVAEAAPRAVDVPDDLAAALAEAGAAEAFAALAPSHRKEWVRWVEEAKKAETRAKRVAETAARVAQGQTAR
jgi:uncharacterized protein YdeI (YjbR/CyaY-like superfamily)